eukprot:359814-Chlamydomonas_euryale.AAC.10
MDVWKHCGPLLILGGTSGGRPVGWESNEAGRLLDESMRVSDCVPTRLRQSCDEHRGAMSKYSCKGGESVAGWSEEAVSVCLPPMPGRCPHVHVKCSCVRPHHWHAQAMCYTGMCYTQNDTHGPNPQRQRLAIPVPAVIRPADGRLEPTCQLLDA